LRGCKRNVLGRDGRIFGSDAVTDTKHTPGPWAVKHEEKWPFDIEIGTVGETVVSMTRIAYSTRQNTLTDVRCAVGFDWNERDDVAFMVAKQEADARLISAAPDLLAVAIEADSALAALGIPENGKPRVQIRAAIAKARGQA
jgi:hypothetical protein